ITYALIAGEELPSPKELGVEYPAYLKGLGEAVGEMRRHILDLIRHGETERGEEILGSMEDIYSVLVTIDYPEAITHGLRRITDMVRGVLERTRGDLTLAIRQTELEKALKEFEERNLGK
ncbi:MAG: haloacid dehalogenase, partial [Anaerolineae bacterium]